MEEASSDEAFLARQPLTNGDRRALRTLLNGPRGTAASGAPGAAPVPAAATRLQAQGITIKRAAQHGPRRIYRRVPREAGAPRRSPRTRGPACAASCARRARPPSGP